MENLLYKDPHLFEYFGGVLVLLLLFGVASFFEKTKTLKNILGAGLVIAPVAYFYLIIGAHLVNIPFTDDFVLLESVQKLRNAPSFLEGVKVLFSQVNQHRFAFERLVMLAMGYFMGTVNLKLLITLGNLFLLGIAYLLFLTFSQERVAWHFFLPVPFVLFNLTFYENAFWGIAAIQNTPLIFFAFLSAYGLGRNDRRGWWLGAVAAFVGTFVSGTGMLAWIIGAIILFFQKNYKSLIPWVLLAIGCLLFYFLFDYQFIQSEAAKPWEHPIFNGLLLAGFWGNALYLDVPHPMRQAFYPDLVASVWLGLAVGLVFLAWTLRYFISRKLRWSYWLVMGGLLFGLGTGAMFVLSRPMSQFFMYGGNILSRRYMIFGAALLAVAYVALVVLTKRLRYVQPLVLVAGLLGFVALNFQSYHTSIAQLRKQHDELSLDGYYWKNYTTFLTAGDNFGDRPYYNHPTRMKELVATVESGGLSGLYASDELPAAAVLAARTRDKSAVFEGAFDARATVRIDKDNLPAEYLTFYTKKETEPAPTNFLLVSEQHVLPLPALPTTNSWQDFLNTRKYYAPHYQYGFYRRKLPSGRFQVWMMSPAANDGRWGLHYTGKIIRLAKKEE